MILCPLDGCDLEPDRGVWWGFDSGSGHGCSASYTCCYLESFYYPAFLGNYRGLGSYTPEGFREARILGIPYIRASRRRLWRISNT